MLGRFSLWCLLLAGCATGPVDSPQLLATTPAPPTQFHAEWREQPLPGKRSTLYTPLLLDGRPVVHARSDSAASLLKRPVRMEGAELGKLRFSWLVSRFIESADLTDRGAADSPVRVILAFEGDHARLSLRNRMTFELAHAVSGETPPFATLMYVWDNKAAEESVILNGATDRIRKIVLESGVDQLGRWRHYERDIAADYRRSFGEEPGALVFVGLMTDADNTRSFAEAWYGEVRLSGRDGGRH